MKMVSGFMGVIGLFTGYYSANAQRIISEASIVYNMVIQAGNKEPQKGDALAGASTTIYLKGNNSRTETVSSLGKEVTIYNSKSDNAVILKEFSGQKLMITLSKDNWKSKNKMYSDVTFELTNDFKTIGTYNTRRAIAKMPDGKAFDVYYTPDLVAANKEYDATFKNLPGLAIQYEIESGKTKFRYNLSKIEYDPVQVSLFDFPTSGYRVMTYEENQNLKKGN
jgi:GLPGLI family protein